MSKWTKPVKWLKTGQNSQKQIKTSQIGSKWAKMAQNCSKRVLKKTGKEN